MSATESWLYLLTIHFVFLLRSLIQQLAFRYTGLNFNQALVHNRPGKSDCSYSSLSIYSRKRRGSFQEKTGGRLKIKLFSVLTWSLLKRNWPSLQSRNSRSSDWLKSGNWQRFLIGLLQEILSFLAFVLELFCVHRWDKHLEVFTFIPRNTMFNYPVPKVSMSWTFTHIALPILPITMPYLLWLWQSNNAPCLCYSGDQVKPLQLIYPLCISIFKTKIRQKQKNNGCSNILVSLPAFGVVTFFLLLIHHSLYWMTCILGSPTVED